uniref:Uncharacterized protein n=1 Tax=Steinernema glaseri TaxID=37863 RepID=A0A1I8ANU7_9BILA
MDAMCLRMRKQVDAWAVKKLNRTLKIERVKCPLRYTPWSFIKTFADGGISDATARFDSEFGNYLNNQTAVIRINEPYIQKQKSSINMSADQQAAFERYDYLLKAFLTMCVNRAPRCLIYEVCAQYLIDADRRKDLENFLNQISPNSRNIKLHVRYICYLHDRRFSFMEGIPSCPGPLKMTEIISGRGLGMFFVERDHSGNGHTVTGTLQTDINVVEYYQ